MEKYANGLKPGQKYIWLILKLISRAEYAKYYIRCAKKIIEKGDDYVNYEIERLENIIKANKRIPRDMAIAIWKLNIIENFDKSTF